jgi:hypothetical protein
MGRELSNAERSKDMQRHLSNDETAVVRKAITADPGWPDYRQRAGITSADLTTTYCWTAAWALGLNIYHILADAEAPAPVENKPAPVPAPVKPAPDELAALQALRSLLGGGQIDAAQVSEIVKAELAAMGANPVVVVQSPGGDQTGELPVLRHPMAETLLRSCNVRTPDGYRLNVWISGPAGSGKTYGAKQISEVLGLRFETHGAMTMAHELTGYMDASGRYHETPFVRAFRNGGAVLLDEIDAGSNEALLALNAALANGFMSLPSGDVVERHSDFLCIAAANTWGLGATADYVGRSRIDVAFLDRFGARLAWDYDKLFERAISGNEAWTDRVHDARGKARDAGLKVAITTRACINGAALVRAGFTPDEAANMTYLASLTTEQVKMLGG